MGTHSGSRIEPLEPPYAPDVEAVLKKWMPPGSPVEPLKLFRILGHHLKLSERMRPLGGAFLGHPTIDLRERELIILRTCARCGAEYEWGVHVMAFAAMVGLDPDLVAATASAGPERVSADERDMLLFRLVDELHDTSSVSDALWDSLSARWNTGQLLEMIALVGFYHLISFIVNATRVELEPWAARFP